MNEQNNELLERLKPYPVEYKPYIPPAKELAISRIVMASGLYGEDAAQLEYELMVEMGVIDAPVCIKGNTELVKCKDCKHFVDYHYSCNFDLCEPSCNLENGLRKPTALSSCSFATKKVDKK